MKKVLSEKIKYIYAPRLKKDDFKIYPIWSYEIVIPIDEDEPKKEIDWNNFTF